MPKKKEKSGEEFWRGKCRELEKELRALRKHLKQIERKEHMFDKHSQDEEIAGDSEDTFPVLKNKKRCGECNKGFMDEFEIMGRIIGTCNICGNREKIK